MVRTTAKAAVLALGSALAFGPGPAAAQSQGYFGPGRDGDYQPPAYDRGRFGQDGGRSTGGGLYGGPLYDREPYGYGYGGAGADRVRPDRSEMERAGRAQFERGYRLGREDERYRLRAQAAHARVLGGGPAEDDDRDAADLLLAHGRQQRAMQDVRQSLQEARTAMRQDDRARVEAALAQADRALRMAGPGVGGDRLAIGWVNQAELALERGDQEAARRAVREARQAVRGPGEAAQQAQGQRPANPAGDGSGGDGGARPEQGGGQQQSGAAGASGPPAR